MALYKYLKKTISNGACSSKTVDSGLFSPEIEEEIRKVQGKSGKKRGGYTRLSQEDKAKVAKYASENGISKARKYFKEMNLKETSVRDWKKAYEKALKSKCASSTPGEASVVIKTLPSKQRGRPPLLGKKMDKELQELILAMHARGASISTIVVVAIGRGLQLKHTDSIPVKLSREWARSVLRRMGFSKQRGSSTSKILPKAFAGIKEQYLIDIRSVVKFEDIPEQLILNWDQTAVKVIPSASWTMEKRGLKRVEISAKDDKRQITAVFACTMSGTFLPVQLIYEGKTPRCLPNITFPTDWHITYSDNHWSTEAATMLEYISHIIVPYITNMRTQLKLSKDYSALVLFDVFKGQCTDKLQPLDLSVNKAAKEQMRWHFQEWYGAMICKQLEDKIEEVVDVRLSVMKPLSAKWIIKTCEYSSSNPCIIKNGFQAAGIVDTLK